jgi:methylthioribulose-1-phosphate dehydratase
LGDQELIREIVNLAKVYYHRQWMFATAGNLSVRSQSPSQFWITASGKNKGKLEDKDFVCVEVNTPAVFQNSIIDNVETNKPSAETSIHRSVYRQFPEVNCVLHVHTLSSNLLSYSLKSEEGYRLIQIPNIEIIKAYGIWTEKPNLEMAVFYNYGDVSQIADQIALFFKNSPNYALPFVLVEEHGPTVWGRSIDEANRHLEATAFLFDVMKESL